MAKLPSSAIGIDVGRHSLKAVRLQRRGRRLALTHFAVKEAPEAPAEALAENLKALLHDLGGDAKACGIAFSSPEALVRIIEQNTIPPELLRDALRINGPMLLSQDCRDWVIDCQPIVSSAPSLAPKPEADAPKEAAPANPPKQEMQHYLVGGLPRTVVQVVHEAAAKNKLPNTLLQLPPVALFNGFEYAHPEVFNNGAFVLVDVGCRTSTVIVGVKGELVLIRTIEYGGESFKEQLILQGAANFEEVIACMAEEEVLTVENARVSLAELIHTVSSSIGFFEAQRDDAIPKIYVSGGLFKMAMTLKLLNEELRLPCELWDPFASCELTLPKMRSAVLGESTALLATAFGVAAEILKER
ncbi:MAG: pilus assembly protein PilM [Chthoniobacteraceae bacterium]